MATDDPPRNSRTFIFRPPEMNERDPAELPDVTGDLGLGSASSIQDVCQVVVDEVSFGDPAWLDPAVQRLQRELPRPANTGEALYLRQTLAHFMDKSAREAHRRFHIRLAPPVCAKLPPCVPHAQWLRLTMPVGQVLDKWHAMYSAWFGAEHVLPAVLRAARILREDFRLDISIEQVARSAGACRTTLTQRFMEAFGLPPSEYLTRVRVREGLRLLRSSECNVDEAARQVGYRSENKFYRRVQALTA